MKDPLGELLEAWRTNQRIHELLIDAISVKGMKCTLSKRGGRNVVRQFAHVHNNRVWHLERRAKPLAKGLKKFETKEEPTKTELKKVLRASAERVATYFDEFDRGDAGHRCFKKGMIPYLAYFVAHESHHRGNILLTLKQCGHPVGKDVAYGVWDWDRR